MIPSHGTYWVNLKGGDRLLVEAWDDDGHPMVVGSRGLIRAEKHPHGFVDVESSEVESVTAVHPGGGWRIVRQDGDVKEEVPVFAWVVDRTGWVWPTVMEDGDSHAWPRDLHGDAIPPTPA
ncbi:hypothetical protein ABT214_09600 [Micromonospora purpureochromogenes]|uniref:hypothetical protein n=1 Tax=Micromonospora purpureochromogenes TaxID=47872 RepID=UPI00332D2A87